MNQSDLRAAIQGAMRLVRFDRAGLAATGSTREAFASSFFAMALLAPFEFLMHAGDDLKAGDFRALLILALAYVIEWLAFPVLVADLVCRNNPRDRVWRYLAAMNWLRVPETMIVAGVTAIGLLTGVSGLMMLSIALVGVFGIAWRWFLARAALGASPAQAVLLVVLFIALAGIIGSWALLTIDPDALARVGAANPG